MAAGWTSSTSVLPSASPESPVRLGEFYLEKADQSEGIKSVCKREKSRVKKAEKWKRRRGESKA